MGYCTAESIIHKSIDYFNSKLSEQSSALRLVKEDPKEFHLRIAKKKNGKPNFDYPSKSDPPKIKSLTVLSG